MSESDGFKAYLYRQLIRARSCWQAKLILSAMRNCDLFNPASESAARRARPRYQPSLEPRHRVGVWADELVRISK